MMAQAMWSLMGLYLVHGVCKHKNAYVSLGTDPFAPSRWRRRAALLRRHDAIVPPLPRFPPSVTANSPAVASLDLSDADLPLAEFISRVVNTA